jgi:hypothetical protein
MKKNGTEMTTEEYMAYIPTEVKNGFLDEEDLIRREIVRYIRVDEEKIHHQVNVSDTCQRFRQKTRVKIYTWMTITRMN